MSAYALHMSGDCWPDNCPVCSQECAGCLEWKHECACPTLPIDTEDNE